MAKSDIAFVCQNCGTPFPRWQGKCNSCGAWNSLVEELTSHTKSALKKDSGSEVVSISDVDLKDVHRLPTGLSELDLVLGGGIVPGSVILIGGDPGIGKSTLSLQLAQMLAEAEHKIYYVTGEESLPQIRMRAQRLGSLNENLLVQAETKLEAITHQLKKLGKEIKLLIIDSIQTIAREEIPSGPGSVAQIRECAHALSEVAKKNNFALVLVGHVTKDGMIAGPKVLEHMVDTVLYFEGERHGGYRILRAIKNRFGSTSEVGIFEMTSTGLKEVGNPSEIFLSSRNQSKLNPSGSIVIPTVEGTRPLLVEVQALVSSSSVGFSRRTYTGIDKNRADIMIAILEKKAGLILSGQDIYLNVAGGLYIEEPAADLGIALAIASSFKNKPISTHIAAIGELGLTGEVRTVSHFEKRISELKKLGFTHCIAPLGNKKGFQNIAGVEISFVENIGEALDAANF
jgi:DNA repair protein RadA/Sms